MYCIIDNLGEFGMLDTVKNLNSRKQIVDDYDRRMTARQVAEKWLQDDASRLLEKDITFQFFTMSMTIVLDWLLTVNPNEPLKTGSELFDYFSIQLHARLK